MMMYVFSVLLEKWWAVRRNGFWLARQRDVQLKTRTMTDGQVEGEICVRVNDV